MMGWWTRHALVAAGVVATLGGGAGVAGGAPRLFTGSWVNDTFGSTGPASASLEIVGTDVTLVFDLDNGPGGIVFGQPVDPDPVTITGTMNPDTSVTVNTITPNPHAVYGTLSAVIASPASATINMADIPSPSLDSGVMTGGVNSPTTMLFNYTVNFTGGGTALGRVLLTEVPEPSVVTAFAAMAWPALRRRRRRTAR